MTIDILPLANLLLQRWSLIGGKMVYRNGVGISKEASP